MANILISVSALALAAIAFACTAEAMPNGNLRTCINQCWYRGGGPLCVARCQRYYGNTGRAAAAHRNPTSTNITNSGNGSRH